MIPQYSAKVSVRPFPAPQFLAPLQPLEERKVCIFARPWRHAKNLLQPLTIDTYRGQNVMAIDHDAVHIDHENIHVIKASIHQRPQRRYRSMFLPIGLVQTLLLAMTAYLIA